MHQPPSSLAMKGVRARRKKGEAELVTKLKLAKPRSNAIENIKFSQNIEKLDGL